MESEIASLLSHYKLKEAALRSKVSAEDLEIISRIVLTHGVLEELAPLLGVAVEDISSAVGGKEHAVLCTWSDLKEDEATYQALLEAIIKTDSQSAAKILCEHLAINSLLAHHKLERDTLCASIIDEHMVEISSTILTGEMMVKLAPYMGMDPVVMDEIERDYKTVLEKKLNFFYKWNARNAKRGNKATYEALLKAMLKVEERDAASRLCALLKNSTPTRQQQNDNHLPSRWTTYLTNWWWQACVAVCVAVCVALCAYALTLYWVPVQDSQHQCGINESLPNMNLLIGREEEMNIIMDSLADTSTQMVVLYGQAGFGKSEIAIHVGYRIAEEGTDVYYLKVEDYSDVTKLSKALMAVSGTDFADEVILRWAKWLKRRTLLILDNVDGPSWFENSTSSREEFKANFVTKLLQNTKLLQVLVTSQQNLVSTLNFKSYQLQSLSINYCVLLVKNSTKDKKPSHLESEELCKLVGNVPLAIKVLMPMVSPDYSLKYIIQRLKVNDTLKINETKKLEYIAGRSGRSTHVAKDRLLSAIELAFSSIEPQYQVCCLLLERYPEYFTFFVMEKVLTSEMMKKFGFKEFYLQECLIELSSKSFLQKKHHWGSIVDYYEFHVLIRDFLTTPIALDQPINMSEIFYSFWENYFGDPIAYIDLHLLLWLPENHFVQDWINILDRNNAISYDLAEALFNHEGYDERKLNVIHRYHYKLLTTAAKKLLADCTLSHRDTVKYYEYHSFIHAYPSSFITLCRDPNFDCIGALSSCLENIPKWKLSKYQYFSADLHRVTRRPDRREVCTNQKYS